MNNIKSKCCLSGVGLQSFPSGGPLIIVCMQCLQPTTVIDPPDTMGNYLDRIPTVRKESIDGKEYFKKI